MRGFTSLRWLWAVLLAAPLFFQYLPGKQAASRPAAKPNIPFIFADDQRADALVYLYDIFPTLA